MLEEALLQMDGIINQSGQGAGGGRGGIVGGDQTSAASSPNPNGSCNILNERSVISNANVLSTAKTLALALQQVRSICSICFVEKKICWFSFQTILLFYLPSLHLKIVTVNRRVLNYICIIKIRTNNNKLLKIFVSHFSIFFKIMKMFKNVFIWMP